MLHPHKTTPYEFTSAEAIKGLIDLNGTGTKNLYSGCARQSGPTLTAVPRSLRTFSGSIGDQYSDDRRNNSLGQHMEELVKSCAPRAVARTVTNGYHVARQQYKLQMYVAIG